MAQSCKLTNKEVIQVNFAILKYFLQKWNNENKYFKSPKKETNFIP